MEQPPVEALETQSIADHLIGLALGISSLSIICRGFLLKPGNASCLNVTARIGRILAFRLLIAGGSCLLNAGSREVSHLLRSFQGRFQQYRPTFATRICAVVVFNHQVQD